MDCSSKREREQSDALLDLNGVLRELTNGDHALERKMAVTGVLKGKSRHWSLTHPTDFQKLYAFGASGKIAIPFDGCFPTEAGGIGSVRIHCSMGTQIPRD